MMTNPQTDAVVEQTRTETEKSFSELLVDRTAEIMKHQIDAVPEIIGNKIDELVFEDSQLIPAALARAIRLLPDPEEAFGMWLEFYETGDENKLKKQISGQPISFLTDFRFRQSMIGALNKKMGVSSVFNNAVGRSLLNLFNMALTPFLVKELGGLSLRHALFFGAFTSARSMIHGALAKDTPHIRALAPYIQAATEQKLTVNLETLLQAAEQPFLDIPEGELAAMKETAIQETKKRLRELTKQSLIGMLAPLEERNKIDVDPSKIPENMEFGIELEGFPLANQKIIHSIVDLWKFFKEEQIPVTDSYRKLITDALFAKTGGAYDTWKITKDPSVVNPLIFAEQNKNMSGSNSYAGMEIVSRILKGPAGGNEAAKVITLLRENTLFTSNDTCGMHLHAGLNDTTLEQRKNLAEALVRNEAKLDMLIDEDRRGGKNQYAKSAAHVDIEEIRACQTISELVDVMCPNGDRNHKFDFTNLDFPGAPPTVQYRCEGGESYLHTGPALMVVLLNFTKAALDNRDITLEEVLDYLAKTKPVPEISAEASAKPALDVAEPQIPAL